MSMVFMWNGTEIYAIPLDEATKENQLYMIDTLSEAYDIPAREIQTKVVRN